MLTAQNIDQAIDVLLLNFVAEKSAAICAALPPVVIAGMTIYLLMTGLDIAKGETRSPIKNLLWDLFRISFIVSISMSIGTYQVIIVEDLDAIGGAVIKAISGVTTFAELMDQMGEPFSILGQKLWSDATTGVWPHLGLLFAAAVISLSQTILFSVGLGFYLLAKISLSLALSVGPIFLTCAIWTSTRKYAENWLGQALNYIFLKVFVSVTIIMLTSFASQFAEHISAEGDAVNVVSSSCALLISCIALAITIISLPHLASALFGGASVAGAGRAAMHSLFFLLDRTHLPSKPKPGPNSISNAGGNTTPPPSGGTPLYQRNTLNHIQHANTRRFA